MTPEERAKTVKGSFLPNVEACLELQANIATAIRAAEEAEREECAKVAEVTDFFRERNANSTIAAAIRAREKK